MKPNEVLFSVAFSTSGNRNSTCSFNRETSCVLLFERLINAGEIQLRARKSEEALREENRVLFDSRAHACISPVF